MTTSPINAHDAHCENAEGGAYAGLTLGGLPIPCHCATRWDAINGADQTSQKSTAEARDQLLSFWDLAEEDLGTAVFVMTPVGPNYWHWSYVDSATNDHGDFWFDADGLWQTAMDEDSTSF